MLGFHALCRPHRPAQGHVRRRTAGSASRPASSARPVVKALKADIAFRTGGTYLTAVVDLVKPRWKPALRVGQRGRAALPRLARRPSPVELTPDPRRPGLVGPLAVKINPGSAFATRTIGRRGGPPALRRGPPPAEAVAATLHLMTATWTRPTERRAGPGRSAPWRRPPDRPGGPPVRHRALAGRRGSRLHLHVGRDCRLTSSTLRQPNLHPARRPPSRRGHGRIPARATTLRAGEAPASGRPASA